MHAAFVLRVNFKRNHYYRCITAARQHVKHETSCYTLSNYVCGILVWKSFIYVDVKAKTFASRIKSTCFGAEQYSEAIQSPSTVCVINNRILRLRNIFKLNQRTIIKTLHSENIFKINYLTSNCHVQAVVNLAAATRMYPAGTDLDSCELTRWMCQCTFAYVVTVKTSSL